MSMGPFKLSRRNRWLRIAGVSLVMYLLASIDRSNLGMAIPAMRWDLGLTPTGVAYATAAFAWGLLVLQIPVGRIAAIWRPKLVILSLLVCVSLISLTTAFVHSELELIVNRFALGLAEGGVLAGMLVLIRAWFTQAERARANTIFLLSLAAAPILVGPISGLILSYSNWGWMFIIEAVPSLLWAVVWWFAVDDDPRRAPWLDEVERALLVRALDAERDQFAALPRHWLSVLWHPAVIILALYNFFALMAEWGVNLWFPTVLRETGLPIGVVGLLSAVPATVGMVVMVVVAISSDRLRERKWHMIATTAVSGLALLLMPLGGNSALVAFCLLTVTVAAFLGRFGPFWTMPSELLPPAVLGAGIGVINAMGILGGIFGPIYFGYLRAATGSFSWALTAAGLSMILSALIALPLRLRRGTGHPAKAPVRAKSPRAKAPLLQPQLQTGSSPAVTSRLRRLELVLTAATNKGARDGVEIEE